MLLTEKQLKEMQFDKFYAIYREPGAGKTFTAKNLILPYCKEQGWKVLFLTHRNTLKAQVKYDIGGFMDENPNTVTIMNYQAIESLVRKLDVEAIRKYFDYQFIICDEAHYFVSDAWNKQSHLSLAFLRYSNAIKLFLTGTPKPLACLNKVLNVQIFDTPNRSIHNLNQLLFFKNIETFDKYFNPLLKEKSNKALMFYGNGFHAWNDVENKFNNGAFICSKTHDLNHNSNNEELDSIIEKIKFNSQILCTTSVLEAGINIEDEDVKLVASIRPYSVHSIVQQFARIRKTKVIGAVVEPHYQAITNWKTGAEAELELINHISKSYSVSDYMKINRLNFNSDDCPAWITAKIDFNGAFVTISFQINEVYVMKLKDMIWQCDFIMEHGYLKLLSQYYEDVEVIDVSAQLKRQKLIEYLESLTNVKMFDEEQEIFIKTLKDNHKIRRSQGREVRKPKEINKILEQINISYKIVQKRIRVNGKQVTIWIIESVHKSDGVVYIQPCPKTAQKDIIEELQINEIEVEEMEVVDMVLKLEEDPFTGQTIVFNEQTQKWENYKDDEWVNGKKIEGNIIIIPDVPPTKSIRKPLAFEELFSSAI
ncbi:DEAD/DEAH box helicase family protein [Fictibacillus sp. KU28468]|uniref:DEAD/DEAH box helicase family protein n=1 Tax=Fictibacillus sp. KU28468 TaxID=2991053 RepID=UPI00223C9AB9|nr:DEAD/DEAH box helicase family protein [Fictibacillus sp. KU28468]UZJ79431.1 DEAD/DEAH box helicase family protein [Fictibacillus sp. KU28468]